ncbi:hypothetical protein D3C81_2013840 [compost metagenome]
MQLRRAALHIQPAGKDAFLFKTVAHAVLHGLPDCLQAAADIGLAAPHALVGQHQLGDPQIVPAAKRQ